jgi:hypothetical protein
VATLGERITSLVQFEVQRHGLVGWRPPSRSPPRALPTHRSLTLNPNIMPACRCSAM